MKRNRHHGPVSYTHLPDTLSEDVLYEVHMTVEDSGDFDLSETEKEIKISAVLGA